MRRIYLDNASTTPVLPAVLDAMMPFLKDEFGNASSLHASGRRARVAIENARERVAALFCAEPSEIVFTSGGTEANNLALRIAVDESLRRGRKRALTSAAEHHSVLRPLQALAGNCMDIRHAALHPDGSVSIDAISGIANAETGFVAFMHVNNETGAVSPLERVAEIAATHGILLFSDTIQSAGKMPIDCSKLPVDLATVSSHKMHGPKGIGALFVRMGIRVTPMLLGGAQERGRRAGTESPALAVGFSAAAELAVAESRERVTSCKQLRSAFLDVLLREYPRCIINGGVEQAFPSILSISFPQSEYPLDGELLVVNLDLEGVEASSGSACSAGSRTPSHVMTAIGHDAATSAATVRISFGAQTTIEDAVCGAQALLRSVTRMLQAP